MQATELKKMVRLKMKGEQVISTKKEDYGLMFAAFCPYHAHTFHSGDCGKWQKLIAARRLERAELEKSTAAKAAERGRKYAEARASTSTDARFK